MSVTRYKWTRTAVVVIAYTIYGMGMSLVGPSIPDLCDRMSIDTAQIGLAFSLGSAAWIVGSLLMGIVTDRFHKYLDFILAASMAGLGIMCAVKPFCPVLWLFIIITIIENLLYAGIDPVANVMILRLWGDHADPKTQALHLCWGVGSTLAPLVMSPFLTDREETTNATTVTPLEEDYALYSHLTDDPTSSDSTIEIPYLIVAGLCFIIAVILVIFGKQKAPEDLDIHIQPRETIKEVLSPETCSPGRKVYAVQMLILGALMYFGISGREYTFSTWLYTYAYESELGFNSQEAALLDAANKASYTGGRLVAVFLSSLLNPCPIMFSVVSMSLLVSGALTVWGPSDKTALWVLSCSLNLLQGPHWATAILFLDKYMAVSALVLGVLYGGAGLSAVIFQWGTGYLFANASPDSFFYILLGCSVLLLAVTCTIQGVGYGKGSRYQQEDGKEEETRENGLDEKSSYSNAGYQTTSTDL